MRAENFSRSFSFFQTNLGGGCRIRFNTAAVSVCHIQVVNFVARLFQKQQRPCHHEFDVVGMRDDGERDFRFVGHEKT